MNSKHFVVAVFFAIVGCVAISSIAQTQNSNVQNLSKQQRPTYEYATLSTQAIQQNNGMIYTVTWNAGVQDIIGRSTTSLVDARRRLTAQLGTGNNTRTNLSVLLSSVGSNGWRLIESSQDEFGTTRIFVRLRPQ